MKGIELHRISNLHPCNRVIEFSSIPMKSANAAGAPPSSRFPPPRRNTGLKVLMRPQNWRVFVASAFRRTLWDQADARPPRRTGAT